MVRYFSLEEPRSRPGSRTLKNTSQRRRRREAWTLPHRMAKRLDKSAMAVGGLLGGSERGGRGHAHDSGGQEQHRVLRARAGENGAPHVVSRGQLACGVSPVRTYTCVHQVALVGRIKPTCEGWPGRQGEITYAGVCAGRGRRCRQGCFANLDLPAWWDWRLHSHMCSLRHAGKFPVRAHILARKSLGVAWMCGCHLSAWVASFNQAKIDVRPRCSLDAASKWRSARVAQLLLYMGADVNAHGRCSPHYLFQRL
jgi:hypothetical protein